MNIWLRVWFYLQLNTHWRTIFSTKWSQTAHCALFHLRVSKRGYNEAHAGVFGAHLDDAKVHSELRRHYWWNGIRNDIMCWTHGWLVCNTLSTGRAVHSPLTPIPVAGPFDRIGVEGFQFPRSHLGNLYAVVFVDYLM